MTIGTVPAGASTTASPAAEGDVTASHEGVAVQNRYFEPMPLVFFNGFITERGALSDSEASACARDADVDPVLVECLEW